MNNIEKVFIDLDDEITFIIERIRNSRNTRVLVIVPDRARLISSIVSLKLLKRYCTKVDKELIVVTTDELGLSLSSKAGIVTVKKVSDIDDVMWERAGVRLAEEKISMEEKANGKKAKDEDLSTKEKEVKEDEDQNKELSESDNKSKELLAASVIAAKLGQEDDIEGNTTEDLGESLMEENITDGENQLVAGTLGANEIDHLEKEKLNDELTNKEENQVTVEESVESDPEIEEAKVEKEDKKSSSNSDLESKPVVVEEKPEDKIRVIKGFAFMPGGDISKVAVASSASLASNTGTMSSAGSVVGASALTGVSATSLNSSTPINKDSEATNSDDDSKSNETDKAKVAGAVVAGATIPNNQSKFSSKKYKPANSGFVVGRDISGVEFKKNKLRTKLDARSANRQSTKLSGKARLPKPPKLNIPIKNKKFLIIGGVVAVLLMVFVYMFVPKAELNITVGSKKITATKEIKADPNITEMNLETSSIPAKITEVVVSGSKSATATGKIQTGEVARGSVMIFNKTVSDIKLPAGQKIVAGDKVYILDNESIVPKTTTVEIPGGTNDIWGTKDVNVRAITYGESYNLNEGSDFLISGYERNVLVGNNLKKITGGTNAEKTVVSQQDFDKAKGELTVELQPKAIEEMKAQLGDKRFFLEDQIKFEVTEAISDPVVGAEGESFDISVTGKATVTSFAKADLDEFSNSLLESMTLEGFVIDEESIKVTSNYLRSEGAVLIVNLQVEAISYQEFDEAEVLNSIKGKSYRKAKEILESNEGIQSFELTINPKWLIGPFKHVPRSEDKINLEVGFVEIESEEAVPAEEAPVEEVEGGE